MFRVEYSEIYKMNIIISLFLFSWRTFIFLKDSTFLIFIKINDGND